jgi:putative tryptophan/tyrosine transport system substrate-binding protein
MRRRAILGVLGAGAFVLAAPAWPQVRGRVARLGWLSLLSPSPDPDLDSFREGLHALGYREDVSYRTVPRYARGDPSRLPALVAELVREKVDVLVARGPVIGAAKAASASVPVLFAFSGNPVEAGVVDSFARPGRNATGVSFMALELSAKRVELLKEIAPNATRIAVVSNPDHAGEGAEYRVTQESAARLGATTSRHLVRTPQDIALALDKVRTAKADALLVFPDALTSRHASEIAGFALREKLPSIYGWSAFAEAGGLISYGPNIREQYRRLATFADKILRGIDAGSIPVEQPARFELVISRATAKALEITLPDSILLRAERVIE